MNKIILTEERSILNAISNLWAEAIKNELQKNVEFSSTLKVTDIEDKGQIKIIKDEKNRYVKTRNSVKRAFKSKRDINTQENRAIILIENDVLEVIESEEKRLSEIVEVAELEKLRKDNISRLKDRHEALAKCEAELSDDALLVMKEKDFEDYLTWKRVEYHEKKEKELKEREAEVKRQEELEEVKKQAKIEAEKEAKEKAELEKQRVQQEKIDAEKKHKEELEKIRQQQLEKEKAERERIENEKQAKIEADDRAKKNEDYIKYTKTIEFDIHQDSDGVRTFYRKVWEYKLN